MNPEEKQLHEALNRLPRAEVPAGFAEAAAARFEHAVRVRFGLHLLLGAAATVLLAVASAWIVGGSLLENPATAALAVLAGKTAVLLDALGTLVAVLPKLSTALAMGSSAAVLACFALLSLLARKSDEAQLASAFTRNTMER